LVTSIVNVGSPTHLPIRVLDFSCVGLDICKWSDSVGLDICKWFDSNPIRSGMINPTILIRIGFDVILESGL